MNRRERDLVSLFNTLWFRDFPITPVHTDFGRRAVWTTHIASVIKQAADLLGYFTCFETGNRTDAVIQTAKRRSWAKVEWEWIQPRFEARVNEIQKLSNASKLDPEALSVYVGYSDIRHHDANLESIQRQRTSDGQLIAFVIQFEIRGRTRHFTQLRTYAFRGGEFRLLRKQEALPWNVKDTRWQLVATAAQLEDSGAAELGDGDDE